MTVMGGKPATHPASYLVFNMANLVATLVAMHFKGVHNRPRPSHVCPALLPPLEVPGHASFPSGHATQAHLFARCAKDMLPVGQQTGMGIVLNALAARIARNREIAGLHYKSDTLAGEYLAGEIHKVLSDETKMPHPYGQPSKFKAAMTSAIARVGLIPAAGAQRGGAAMPEASAFEARYERIRRMGPHLSAAAQGF